MIKMSRDLNDTVNEGEADNCCEEKQREAKDAEAAAMAGTSLFYYFEKFE